MIKTKKYDFLFIVSLLLIPIVSFVVFFSKYSFHIYYDMEGTRQYYLQDGAFQFFWIPILVLYLIYALRYGSLNKYAELIISNGKELEPTKKLLFKERNKRIFIINIEIILLSLFFNYFYIKIFRDYIFEFDGKFLPGMYLVLLSKAKEIVEFNSANSSLFSTIISSIILLIPYDIFIGYTFSISKKHIKNIEIKDEEKNSFKYRLKSILFTTLRLFVYLFCILDIVIMSNTLYVSYTEDSNNNLYWLAKLVYQKNIEITFDDFLSESKIGLPQFEILPNKTYILDSRLPVRNLFYRTYDISKASANVKIKGEPIDWYIKDKAIYAIDNSWMCDIFLSKNDKYVIQKDITEIDGYELLKNKYQKVLIEEDNPNINKKDNYFIQKTSMFSDEYNIDIPYDIIYIPEKVEEITIDDNTMAFHLIYALNNNYTIKIDKNISNMINVIYPEEEYNLPKEYVVDKNNKYYESYNGDLYTKKREILLSAKYRVSGDNLTLPKETKNIHTSFIKISNIKGNTYISDFDSENKLAIYNKRYENYRKKYSIENYEKNKLKV
mgnify:CR=1 FL=1